MCFSSNGPRNIPGGSNEKVASECVKKRKADFAQRQKEAQKKQYGGLDFNQKIPGQPRVLVQVSNRPITAASAPRPVAAPRVSETPSKPASAPRPIPAAKPNPVPASMLKTEREGAFERFWKRFIGA